MLLLSSTFNAVGQNGLVAHYSFDDCAVTDETGMSVDGVISGSPECGCGVEGNALYFDGQNDYVEFFNNAGSLLSQDFTASFYILPENTTGIVDIFSKRAGCFPDSAVAIRYEVDTRTIKAELTEGINERAEIEMVLPEDECWFHITWVRSGRQLALFLNGRLMAVQDFNDQIDARNQGIFSIANSPCLGNGESRFRGALDEFKIFDRALSEEEVATLYIPIDEIASRDTILFVGESVQILLPNSCANSFLWTPPQGVSNAGDQEPLITPPANATYGVVMNYGFCRAIDTIRIIVVDSSQLDCDDVFLPNAFTPNGDGLNDDFGLSNATYFLGDFISMEIYDRWGGRLFEGLTTFEKWDGTINGEEALPSIYIYKLRYRCNGEDKIASGSFNLLR